MPLNYLLFERSEGDDGVVSFEAMASTRADQHAQVIGEVQQVLAWARQRFPHGQGPAEEGMDWDHDLQVSVEPGQWHTVMLTLTCSQRFADEFTDAFCAEGA